MNRSVSAERRSVMELSKKILITIGREEGSGGRAVAEALGKDLNIPVFDKNMIERIAKEHGYDEDVLSSEDEKLTNPFFEPYTKYGMDTALSEKLFIMESKIIREEAEKGSAIFIGRCADDVLSEFPDLLNVFIFAPKADRIRRVAASEGFTAEEAERQIKRIDKQRRAYYQFYTDRKWGMSDGMDLMLNSSSLTLEGCAAAVEACLKTKGYLA